MKVSRQSLIQLASSVTDLPLSLLIAHGHTVLSVVEQPLEQEPIHAGKNTVTYEARLLKALFLRTRK